MGRRTKRSRSPHVVDSRHLGAENENRMGVLIGFICFSFLSAIVDIETAGRYLCSSIMSMLERGLLT